LYFLLWLYENERQLIRLRINGSTVEIKFGNIFDEKAELKAIAFNEYYDTQVDNIIVAEKSLHGQYIKKYFADNVSDLDSIIDSSPNLQEAMVSENVDRPVGKKRRYRLGTVVPVEGHLLIAFSRFDQENKAFLEMADYISCLLNFWNEVYRVYGQRTVALTVLGSGITRFNPKGHIADQELLELILWTFKVSRITIKHPARIKIVIFPKDDEPINFLKLKDLET
jgi:hypothetical protein